MVTSRFLFEVDSLESLASGMSMMRFLIKPEQDSGLLVMRRRTNLRNRQPWLMMMNGGGSVGLLQCSFTSP